MEVQPHRPSQIFMPEVNSTARAEQREANKELEEKVKAIAREDTEADQPPRRQLAVTSPI